MKCLVAGTQERLVHTGVSPSTEKVGVQKREGCIATGRSSGKKAVKSSVWTSRKGQPFGRPFDECYQRADGERAALSCFQPGRVPVEFGAAVSDKAPRIAPSPISQGIKTCIVRCVPIPCRAQMLAS